MDSRQARQVLSHYRPGDSDPGDPLLSEALALAQRDPDLAIWFGQHCAAQARNPGASTLPTPPAVATPLPGKKPGEEERVIMVSKWAVFLIGAAILILFIGAIASQYASAPDNITFANYRDRMARMAQRAYPMKITSTDQGAIREYLGTNGGPNDFIVPRGMEQLPAIGGAVLTWHNQPVSLLGLNAGGNTNLFLFLVRRSAFQNLPIPTKTEFARVGKLMTASWSENDDIYLVAGPDDVATLQSYLVPPP
jgi:hypothetical protein